MDKKERRRWCWWGCGYIFMGISAEIRRIQAGIYTSLQRLVEHLRLKKSKSKAAAGQRMCREYKFFSLCPQGGQRFGGLGGPLGDFERQNRDEGKKEQTPERGGKAIRLYHGVNFPEVAAACKLKRAEALFFPSTQYVSACSIRGRQKQEETKGTKAERKGNFKSWKIRSFFACPFVAVSFQTVAAYSNFRSC